MAERHPESGVNILNQKEEEALVPIRTLARLTGVNAVTIRAWERRYGLLQPVRTPKGHRLYRQSDIDLIQRVVELLGRGIAISQVKVHLAATKSTSNAQENVVVEVGPWQQVKQRFINAIVRFDVSALDGVYNEVLSLYPVDVVTEKLILPLLQTLGSRWAQEEGSIAEEHFFGTYLRNKLGARFHHHPISASAPKLLAACLPGEYHEIGLLLFSLAALNRGWHVILLGANTPLRELVIAQQRSGAMAIVVSGSLTTDASSLQEDIAALVASVNVPVFVGGHVAVREHDAIVKGGAHPLGTHLAQALTRIDAVVGTKSP